MHGVLVEPVLKSINSLQMRDRGPIVILAHVLSGARTTESHTHTPHPTPYTEAAPPTHQEHLALCAASSNPLKALGSSGGPLNTAYSFCWTTEVMFNGPPDDSECFQRAGDTECGLLSPWEGLEGRWQQLGGHVVPQTLPQ